MISRVIAVIGLIFVAISQTLMSFGYAFLMSQRPIDFAHWALLVGSLMMIALWFCLLQNLTKRIGLTIMTIGIAGIIGMCTIDFILWSADSNQELKESIMGLIETTPSICFPFLIGGPSLFYAGLCIATYGLLKEYTLEVILINVGGMMIGLGHMMFRNAMLAALGSGLLLVGMMLLIFKTREQKSVSV